MAVSETKLLPCPFCGGEAEIAGEAKPLQFVTCKACDVCTRYRSLPEATKHWNTRALTAALSDQVVVPKEPTGKDRLDFLDRCSARLNAKYQTSYSWKLILNHNVNRLMLGHMVVDLADVDAKGLLSCRDAIDAEIKRIAASAPPPEPTGDNGEDVLGERK